MVAVTENGFTPVGVVQRKGFLFGFAVDFVGETDLHVDKESEFIGGTDKIFRGARAVETHQIESVFLRL